MSYWEENKEALSKKRRKRWKGDPELRRRQRERDERARERKRREALKGAQREAVERAREEGFPLDIPALGRVLQRTPTSIRAWLRDGTLPGVSGHGPGVNGRRDRLFDERYVEVIVEAFYGTLRQNLRGDAKVFRALVRHLAAKGGVEVKREEDEEEKEGASCGQAGQEEKEGAGSGR